MQVRRGVPRPTSLTEQSGRPIEKMLTAPPDAIAEREFTLADQQAFAAFSGDFNPIHVDPVYARRSIAGGAVVHGVHTLLWALDAASATRTELAAFEKLRVQFEHPILIGDRVQCVERSGSNALHRLNVIHQKQTVVRIEIEPGSPREPLAVPMASYEPAEPVALTMDQFEGRSGNWALAMDAARAARLFPILARGMDPSVLAMLVQSSRLVGMECPGLDSLYSELELVRADGRGQQFEYRVTDIDTRFRLVTIDLAGGGLAGTLRAFARPPQTTQSPMSDLAREVSNGEFEGQRALVVGGSRGLGELSAKLLAAGGADVCLTYAEGSADAMRVVGEIEAHGKRGRAIRFDVLSGRKPELPADWSPTHLYYFASPFIFSGRPSGWDDALANKFTGYYVTGFARLVESLVCAELSCAFYPSTIALEEASADMAEYCAAKAGGEALCDVLRRRHRGLTILAPRLPRVATDQTASLLPVANLDPLLVMLGQLRTLAAVSPASGERKCRQEDLEGS